MAVILVGSGVVVERLLGQMESHGRDVVLVTPDAHDAESYAFAFPRALVIAGDGRDPSVLKQAQAADATLLVAATDDDAFNLSVCLLARDAYHIPSIVGLASHSQNVRIFDALDIACIASSEIVANAVLGALTPRSAVGAY